MERTVTIEIPEEITRATKIPLKEIQNLLRQELAIRLYEQEMLSFGKAGELAGLSKWEFHRLLGEMGVNRQYDLDEFQEDLDTLEQMK